MKVGKKTRAWPASALGSIDLEENTENAVRTRESPDGVAEYTDASGPY